MKKFLVSALVLCSLLAASPSWAVQKSAQIAQTAADTASVLLDPIRSTQRYLVKSITVFYDNAANTNPLYVALQLPSHSRTRYFWTGQAMTSSGIATLQWSDINTIVDAPADSTAGGLRFFISATTSDSLWAHLDYEVITY